MKLPELKISVKRKKGEEFTITNSDDVVNAIRSVMDADTIEWKEEMVMLLLDRKHSVIGWHKISSGGTAGTVCDPKVVFTVALKGGASKIILAHNHPSGNLEFSNADKRVSRQLKDGGDILDVQLLDSLIITKDSHSSLADCGLL